MLEFSRLISLQYFTIAPNHVPCPQWMREIKREGNGRWLWMEMMLILMRKIVGISLRLFLNGDVDICLLFDKCIPRAEGRADVTSGRWRFIVSVTLRADSQGMLARRRRLDYQRKNCPITVTFSGALSMYENLPACSLLHF